MARAARLLELLIRLRATPRVTAQELADHFEVSRRTMLRDLQTLSDLGVPLVATPGPGGGYTLTRDQRLAPLALTADEALGVLLSYEAFLRYAQSPFAAESLSAATKLRATLPPDVARDLERVQHHVAIIARPHGDPAPLLGEILRAALDGVHLRVVYDSRSGVSERISSRSDSSPGVAGGTAPATTRNGAGRCPCAPIASSPSRARRDGTARRRPARSRTGWM